MSRAFLVAAAVFLMTAPLGGPLIRFLRAHGIGKRIREDGPSSHRTKMGTPTMGGILILAPVIVAAIVLTARGESAMLVPLGAVLAFGLLGAADDAMGLTTDKDAPLAPQLGILARHMFLYQTGIALILSAACYWGLGLRGVVIPKVLNANLGIAFIPVASFVIVAMTNAVNLTDGLDGLAGGTSALAFACYGLIAHLQGQSNLSLLCWVTVGALMAFLWYNAYPAQVFMGGIGSYSLGGLLAAVALMTQAWLLLPVIGIVFLAVEVSDIIQIGYFKYTRRRYGQGRRVFRMAPLHHHFELSGWSQVQVVQRFWIAGALGGLIGLAFFTL